MTLTITKPAPGYGAGYGENYGTGRPVVQLHVARAPDHSQTAYRVTNTDVKQITASERANQPADTGTVVLANDNFERSLSDACPEIDDKLTGFVAIAADDRGLGEGAMGAGPMGGWRRAGTWLVTNREITDGRDGPSEIRLDVQDYTYAILGQRRAFAYADDDKPVVGSEGAHINQLLQAFAPQVGRGALPALDVRTDYSVHGKWVKDAVDELAGVIANEYGSVIHYSHAGALHLRPLSAADAVLRFDEPFTARDFEGDLSSAREGTEFVNQMRVDGSIDTRNVGDEQTTVDHFVSVTNSNKLEVRLDIPKPEVPRVEVYTKGDGTSGDGLRVRLQRDIGDGTGPIAPTDTDRDLVNSGPRKVALDDDGFTTFRLGSHDAFERDPWLIIDSPGSDGYDVGVDANDVPAYKAHFAKPIIADIPEGSSQNEYLRHDGHVSDDAITTAEAARARARSILARKGFPTDVFGGDAATDRAHRLRVGDVVELDLPKYRVESRAAVTGRTVRYSDITLKTELEFRTL